MAWFLGLIFTLSCVIRGFSLNAVPPELFGDEIDVGYQAYSLLKTGRDIYNQPLPLYIHSLSEWRMPLLMYATVPTIAIFGLNEIGVRLPEVIFGSLAPIILYFLSYQISRNKKLSLLSSLSLVFLPWHIHYSRAAFEVVYMLDLIMLGTLLFLRRKHTLSALFFALSMYTYSTAIVFTPLWIIALLFLNRKRPSLVSFLTFTLILAPLFYYIFAGPAAGRFNTVSIFSGSEVVKSINEARIVEHSGISWIFNNKVISYFQILSANYLRAFSSEFLFIKGDPIFRHSLQIVGGLLPLSAPLLLLGLWQIIKRRQWLWLVWLVLAPLPSIFTADGGFHATRLFLMIPPLVVALGSGGYLLIKISNTRKLLPMVYCLVLILQFIWVGHYYLVRYPKDSWRWWHVGFKSVMTEAAKLSSSYTHLFINNTYEPSLIRFLFYSGYSPQEFHRQFILDKPIQNVVPDFDGYSLDGKNYFGTFATASRKNGISSLMRPGNLYVISQRDDVGGDWDWRKSPPENIKVLYTSTDPNGFPILYLVTSK